MSLEKFEHQELPPSKSPSPELGKLLQDPNWRQYAAQTEEFKKNKEELTENLANVFHDPRFLNDLEKSKSTIINAFAKAHRDLRENIKANDQTSEKEKAVQKVILDIKQSLSFLSPEEFRQVIEIFFTTQLTTSLQTLVRDKKLTPAEFNQIIKNSVDSLELKPASRTNIDQTGTLRATGTGPLPQRPANPDDRKNNLEQTI